MSQADCQISYYLIVFHIVLALKTSKLQDWRDHGELLKSGTMLQIQSPWREAERGLCWRHLSCSGRPSLLETPGLWQVCQEQWQIWSGADLSLHDKLCVLRTAKLEKCGQSSHLRAAGFIFILPDFVYDGMWLFYALDLAFWNKKQCILNLLEIIVKRPNFQQDFQLLKCWNFRVLLPLQVDLCSIIVTWDLRGKKREIMAQQ